MAQLCQEFDLHANQITEWKRQLLERAADVCGGADPPAWVGLLEWHIREAWRSLMFADEDQAAKLVQDPVAPAKRSDAAMKKARERTLEDGTPVHSFQSLMQDLQTIVRNTCRTPQSAEDAPGFEITTMPSNPQRRALDLIGQIKLQSERGARTAEGFRRETWLFSGGTSD